MDANSNSLETAGTDSSKVLRIATFNLENYHDDPAVQGGVKSAESKAKVRECIRALNPDAIALQEVGGLDALRELRESLRTEGLDFPHWEHVTAWDPDLHLAVLSRYPFTARRPHTQDSFKLGGRQYQVRRGFADVEVQVTPTFSFTLLVAHLKSKREVPEVNADELRIAEARLLRQKIDVHLVANPEARLIVLGDLNDAPHSVAVQTIIGTGAGRLVDTRPTERNGDNTAATQCGGEHRNITWTNFHHEQDRYDRVDYILLSPALARFWMAEESYVLAVPNWGVASDHRPLTVAIKVPKD